LFADDTGVVANSREKLQNLVTELGRVCHRRKLKVNVAKRKLRRCSGDGGIGGADIVLNGERLGNKE